MGVEAPAYNADGTDGMAGEGRGWEREEAEANASGTVAGRRRREGLAKDG